MMQTLSENNRVVGMQVFIEIDGNDDIFRLFNALILILGIFNYQYYSIIIEAIRFQTIYLSMNLKNYFCRNNYFTHQLMLVYNSVYAFYSFMSGLTAPSTYKHQVLSRNLNFFISAYFALVRYIF